MRYEDWLDQVSVLFEERRLGEGEDSFYAACGPGCAVAAVADGSGGLGSRRYAAFRSHTGAYLGSRIVSAAVEQWFAACGGRWTGGLEVARVLDGCLRRGFQICRERLAGEAEREGIGSLSRPLPSTLAMLALRRVGEETRLCIVWAGDSRVYLLDERGLRQLTRDDVEGGSAEDLSVDGALENVLSADGNFRLNTACCTLRRPCLVLAATDGCFGYLQTPMEFEYYLLHALTQSETPEGFERSLRELLHDVAGDDFTLAYASVGMGDFAATRQRLLPRYQWMWREVIAPLYEAYESGARERIEQTQQRLWRAYRPDYERQMAGEETRRDGMPV